MIFRWPWFSAILGIALALVVLPLLSEIGIEVRDGYDELFPPAEAQAEAIGQDGGVLTFRLTITKRRECEFVRMIGYQRVGDAPMERLTMARGDGQAAVTHPAGVRTHTSAWTARPVTNGGTVLIYFEHMCGGRLVRVKADEMKVPK